MYVIILCSCMHFYQLNIKQTRKHYSRNEILVEVTHPVRKYETCLDFILQHVFK